MQQFRGFNRYYIENVFMEVNMNDKFIDNYQKIKGDLYRLAYSYTLNETDAEDILQDVFVELYKNIDFLTDEKHIKKWCIRVTINKCKDLRKSMWKRSVFSFSENEERKIYYKESKNEVLNEILKLPVNYKITLFLYYYEGYKSDEIAKILNKKETTIRSYLYRGREKLKNLIKEEV